MKFRSANISAAAVTAFLALTGVASADPGIDAQAGNAVSAIDCNLVVAPNGSDSNPGTVAAPLRTSNAAVAALRPGQTLCFRGGTYQTTTGLSIRAANSTTTSFPGEHATLLGSLRVERPATGAVVENLTLNGKNPDNYFNPIIYADNAVMRNNEITNDHTTNCVHLAHYYDDPAPTNVIIENNDIHDCGVLPAQNHQHGIYIAASRHLIIRNNLIYDNADRGIQLYTDVRDTEIYGNVINNNGVGIIISGAGGETTSDTQIHNNVITNSNIRHNIESWYESGTNPGTNNVVSDNCIYGVSSGSFYAGRDNSGIGDQVGFTARNNVVANPRFADAAGGNFALQVDSPCAAILAGAGASTDPATTPTTPATTPTETEPAPAEPIQLDTKKPTVMEGSNAVLTGTVPQGVGEVWIQIKGKRHWRIIGVSHVHGTKFSTRVRVRATAHYKAKANGALDSNAVKVAAIDRKHKHKHKG
jgi:parallel beta-helix repeat protein